MQEVFEKMIERLEKLSDELYKAYCIGFNSDDRAEYDAYVNAIDIVKQEAENYKSTEHINCSSDSSTDGWIPCDVRLPEQTKPFQTEEYTVTMVFVKNGKRSVSAQ